MKFHSMRFGRYDFRSIAGTPPVAYPRAIGSNNSTTSIYTTDQKFFRERRAMVAEDPKTSGTLLRRARSWDDQAAWQEMFRRYQPLLQRWSRRTLRDADDAAEVSQLVWVELARRIHEFDYDPHGSFRGWLRRLHRSRSLDFLKGRKRYHERLARFATQPDSQDAPRSFGSESWVDSRLSNRLDKQSRLVDLQTRVRSRVSPQTWQIFWSVVVENRTVSEVAAEHSMRYASAFAAVARVTKMLQREAQR